jgi:hypothetical protein
VPSLRARAAGHVVLGGFGGLTLYVQPLFLDPAPALWLGAGTSFVLP